MPIADQTGTHAEPSTGEPSPAAAVGPASAAPSCGATSCPSGAHAGVDASSRTGSSDVPTPSDTPCPSEVPWSSQGPHPISAELSAVLDAVERGAKMGLARAQGLTSQASQSIVQALDDLLTVSVDRTMLSDLASNATAQPASLDEALAATIGALPWLARLVTERMGGSVTTAACFGGGGALLLFADVRATAGTTTPPGISEPPNNGDGSMQQDTKPTADAMDRHWPLTRGTLAGKVAVVTGSTSGIGLGIARSLAEAGANVMLNGFGDLDEIEQIRSRLERNCPGVVATATGMERDCGVKAAYSRADMSKPDEIAGMIADTVGTFGRVDILVNNAGIQHVEAIESFPIAKWDAILSINLSSAFHSIRAAVPHMKAQGFGRIINVASAHALVASPFKSAYVAAKHGVLGLTKAVALETAEHGITANAICPGYVLTPLVEKQIPETAKARGLTADQVVRDVLLHAQPTRRFVSIEEIGALAVFLCTPGAASITGAALPIEGGWTAQ